MLSSGMRPASQARHVESSGVRAASQARQAATSFLPAGWFELAISACCARRPHLSIVAAPRRGD